MHGKLLRSALPLFFLCAPAAAASRADTWRLKPSPHFAIYHESSWPPQSVALDLEALYGRLRLDFAMFAPWMTREKTKIYIYRSQKSYLAGEFNPPKWSKGLAYFNTKTVVVYDSGDKAKLRGTLAHELSHLYFESFYGEKLKNPPQWLNEGLAVMMEDAANSREGPWSASLKYFPQDKIIPLTSFFSVRLDQLQSDTEIGYWYMQAFGVTRYLFRPNTRIKFKQFCTVLRDGGKLEPTLWRVYRVRDLREFDRTWREWVRNYGAEKKSGFSFEEAFPSASFNLH